MKLFVLLLHVPLALGLGQTKDTIAERHAEILRRLAAEEPRIQSALRHDYLSDEIQRLGRRIVRTLTVTSHFISKDALNDYRQLAQTFNANFGEPYRFLHQIQGVSPLPLKRTEIAKEVFRVWRSDAKLSGSGWIDIGKEVTWRNLPLAIRLLVSRGDLTAPEISQIASLLARTKNSGLAHMRFLTLRPRQFFSGNGMIDHDRLDAFFKLTRWSAQRRFCQAALGGNAPQSATQD